MNFGRRRVPDRRVLAGLAEPGRVLLPHVPAGLMLKPVVRPREDRPALVPDDLLVVQEADPQQAVEHLAREHRGVPDVSDLEARHQFECFGPVGPGVAGDRGLGVALGPLLHVAGLGRPAAVQAGAIAPLGIELDAVGRVGDHQLRLAVAQEPRHILRAGGVAAEDPVLLPQSHRSPGRETGFSGTGGDGRSASLLVRDGEQVVDLLGVEAGEAEVEVRRVEFLQFEREQFLVPVGPGDRAVHHQPEGLHLRRRPLVAEDHRHFGDAQLARGLQAEVAVDDLAVAAREHRDLESELADAAAHAIHRGVVLSGIARVKNKLVDRPLLECCATVLEKPCHTSSRKIELVEDSFGGCALRWPDRTLASDPNLT